MSTSGDVVDLDLGAPEGREAGFRHLAVLVTAQRILRAVSPRRILEVRGNVGAGVLAELRETIAVILDLP